MKVCSNDAQVSRALTAWVNYSPSNPDPSVEFNAHTSASRGTLKQLWSKASSTSPAKVSPVDSAMQAAPALATSQDTDLVDQSMPSVAATAASVPDLEPGFDRADPDVQQQSACDAAGCRTDNAVAASQPQAFAEQGQASANYEVPVCPPVPSGNESAAGSAQRPAAAANAFSAMMSAAKRPRLEPKPAASTSAVQSQRGAGAWQGALQRVARDPHRCIFC